MFKKGTPQYMTSFRHPEHREKAFWRRFDNFSKVVKSEKRFKRY
jgi:hypothetical protein